MAETSGGHPIEEPADRDRAHLEDILISARLASEYLAGAQQGEFASNTQLQDAVIRRLELIGEAARRMSADGRQRWPNLPWQEMIGMRNVVVHDYDEIDLSIVWVTVERDLPDLVAALEGILGDDGRQTHASPR